jgi:hypothetical protein
MVVQTNVDSASEPRNNVITAKLTLWSAVTCHRFDIQTNLNGGCTNESGAKAPHSKAD